jgi:hypothetical protein
MMNERIKELAKQADTYALETIGEKWIGWEEIASGWVECRDSKFAELIIQECADIGERYADGNYEIRNQILIHFGLEEPEE